MYKIFIVFVLTLLMPGVVYCQSFSVKEVSADLEEAVIYNSYTGEERTVSVCDEVNGWVITEITPDDIIIMKPGNDDHPILMSKIPVKSGVVEVKENPSNHETSAE